MYTGIIAIDLLINFVIFHTIYFVSILLFNGVCYDSTAYGYISSMIYGHSLFCQFLLSIAYHSQQNIMKLFVGVSVVTSVTTFISNLFRSKNTKEREKNIKTPSLERKRN